MPLAVCLIILFSVVGISSANQDLATQGNPPAAAPADPPAPGRTLTTAEIVARTEPSVALIKGEESGGTGFLVKPGILVTNAHVIDGEVIQNLKIRFPSAPEGKRGPFQAELIDQDVKRDLAFLAVPTDLPPLEIAGAYRFRKGEDITIIGSPAVGPEQVLENAISRGILSTEATFEGHSYYQLGVAVNHGNSGGPVLDAAGRVIGVITSKAWGEEVAFCIPVEDLRRGIERATGLKEELERAEKNADDVTLRYGWKPGQTFVYSLSLEITPEIGPYEGVVDGKCTYTVKEADERKAVINGRSSVSLRRTVRHGYSDLEPELVQQADPYEVTFEASRTGNRLGEAPSVFFERLDDLPSLILEPLPEQAASRWQVSHAVTLMEAKVKPGSTARNDEAATNEASFFLDRFGPRWNGRIVRPPTRFYRPFGRASPFGPRIAPVPARDTSPEYEFSFIRATETVHYRLGRRDGDTVEIRKQYELRSEAKENDQPGRSLVGEGVTSFDLKDGLPRSIEFHGKLVLRQKDVTARIPISFLFQRQSDASSNPIATTAVMPPTTMRPITEDALNRDLSQLKAEESDPRRLAASRLADAAPIEARRTEVARALESLLDDHRDETNLQALRALGVWGDDKSRSPLIARLRDATYDGRREATYALARLGPDPEAALAIAECLGAYGLELALPIQAMGSEAEPALLKIAKGDGDASLRASACTMLGLVGTATSKSTLMELAASKDSPEIARAAEAALKIIGGQQP